MLSEWVNTTLLSVKLCICKQIYKFLIKTDTQILMVSTHWPRWKMSSIGTGTETGCHERKSWGSLSSLEAREPPQVHQIDLGFLCMTDKNFPCLQNSSKSVTLSLFLWLYLCNAAPHMLEIEAYTPEPNTDRLQRVQFAGQSTIWRVSGRSTARVPQLIGVGTKKCTM